MPIQYHNSYRDQKFIRTTRALINNNKVYVFPNLVAGTLTIFPTKLTLVLMINVLYQYCIFTAQCDNGGECVDGINDYSCACATGFTGEFCQINLFDCASSPCLNDAKCVDLASVCMIIVEKDWCIKVKYSRQYVRWMFTFRDIILSLWFTLVWFGIQYTLLIQLYRVAPKLVILFQSPISQKAEYIF